jgi:hypothetical protein
MAGPAYDTCQGCHMDARRGPAAVDPQKQLPERTLHEHLWPAVDVALTEFPDRELQRRAVECALANGTRIAELVPTPLGEFTVTLETNAGHAQPSGASQHRRLWLELVAYDADDNVLYESGRVDDGEALDESDPALWLMRDHLYDAEGKPVHMMWDAAASELHTRGYEGSALPALQKLGQAHTLSRTYRTNVLPERVTVRLRMRPIGLDVLEDLVQSGDLDSAVVSAMPTFTLYGSALEWKRSDGFVPRKQPDASPLRCPEDYLCMLDPAADVCTAGD